jgi:protoporphyrinogen oxidase
VEVDSVDTLVIGAGVSGLATAAALGKKASYLVLEADREIGGYCKTVVRDGFVWDYSGHFFHFKRPEIEAWLRARMPGQAIREVDKRSYVHWPAPDGDRRIDFPFQKNIHQLPQADFIDCLHDLYFARAPGVAAPQAENNFKEMLYARFGRGIAERFLIPYNEKLYAVDLAALDRDAMGRFFPHADLTDVVRNMKQAENASYNARFTYPQGGAIEYVKAIASEVATSKIALFEPLIGLDLGKRRAKTPKRDILYQRLVSSVPLPRLLNLAHVPYERSTFTWNQVLVFNLGFDAKGADDVHWMYFPQRDLSFYRVGWYDNIFATPRMSLYVELGFPRGARIDVAAERERVLADLRRAGVVTHQRLVAEHSVIMDPAYVHITRDSLAATARLRERLAGHGVYSIGRYGGWTYCSIEDNIVEARALVAGF